MAEVMESDFGLALWQSGRIDRTGKQMVNHFLRSPQQDDVGVVRGLQSGALEQFELCAASQRISLVDNAHNLAAQIGYSPDPGPFNGQEGSGLPRSGR